MNIHVRSFRLCWLLFIVGFFSFFSETVSNRRNNQKKNDQSLNDRQTDWQTLNWQSQIQTERQKLADRRASVLIDGQPEADNQSRSVTCEQSRPEIFVEIVFPCKSIILWRNWPLKQYNYMHSSWYLLQFKPNVLRLDHKPSYSEQFTNHKPSYS